MTIVSILLDLVLIGLLGVGISYAVKLTGQLADMRAHRSDMERFVLSFNATVDRAEAGIRGLKGAARSSGDDLERLIEKGGSLREELLFLTESADQIATRLTNTAGTASRGAQTPMPEERATPSQKNMEKKNVTALPATVTDIKVASSAERDLLRALGKKG